MDTKHRDELIEKLLLYIKDKIEQDGMKRTIFRTDFIENHDQEYLDHLNINRGDLQYIVKVCLSRDYLEHQASNAGQFGCIGITQAGYEHAISTEQRRAYPSPVPSTDSITIGVVNNSGNTQIGNHNTQSNDITILNLIDAIENSEASDADKTDAKNRLLEAIKHPLTQTLLSGMITTGAHGIIELLKS